MSSDSSRELPFTRSRCVGGIHCVAGCTLHKKVRKRTVKSTGVLIQHSGYGIEPEIEFSDEEDKKSITQLKTINDVCKQNGLNHYYEQNTEDLMSEDDIYEEITYVRRVNKIFRTTITHTSNLINYVTPKPMHTMHKKYPYLWPFLLLLSLLGTSAYLLSRNSSSSPLLTDSVVDVKQILNSDTSTNYAFNQIENELKSIKSELESLKKAHNEINTKLNNENVVKDDKFVKLNNKVDNLEKVIIDMMRNCCKNETENISSLIDTRLAAFIASMLTNDNNKQSQLTPKEAANELKTIINSEIERSNKNIMESVELKLMSTLENLEKHVTESNNNDNNIGYNNISIDEIKLIIQNAIAIYDADKTGQPDFALEPAGGTVINTRCSETFDPYGIQYRIFGMPVWSSSVSPRAVIQPTISPGECWAFKGSQGYLVIKLSQLIVPTAFSYEHIPKQISRDGNINSAPKEFQIRGLDDETDTKGHLLGNYVYEDNNRPMQHFLVQDPNPTPFQFIELIILSNHGHEEYTCLYRFRVHGKRVNY